MTLSHGCRRKDLLNDHGDFDRIAIMLRAAVNYARWREFLCAEAVHPSLRTAAEKKIVHERLPRFAFANHERYTHALHSSD
jgi:hypothetical protein